MTDLKRAALAIHATKEFGAAPGWPWGSSSSDVAISQAYATAVIEALAEPSQAMVEALRAALEARKGLRLSIRAAMLAALGRTE